jgi:flagellar hook assembly protein FlgD
MNSDGGWTKRFSDLSSTTSALPTILFAEPVPNPFNSTVTIRFTVSSDLSNATVNVSTIDGRTVKTIVSGDMNKGIVNTVWDGTDIYGKDLPSGTYIVSVRSSFGVLAGCKVTLIR